MSLPTSTPPCSLDCLALLHLRTLPLSALPAAVTTLADEICALKRRQRLPELALYSIALYVSSLIPLPAELKKWLTPTGKASYDSQLKEVTYLDNRFPGWRTHYQRFPDIGWGINLLQELSKVGKAVEWDLVTFLAKLEEYGEVTSKKKRGGHGHVLELRIALEQNNALAISAPSPESLSFIRQYIADNPAPQAPLDDAQLGEGGGGVPGEDGDAAEGGNVLGDEGDTGDGAGVEEDAGDVQVPEEVEEEQELGMAAVYESEKVAEVEGMDIDHPEPVNATASGSKNPSKRKADEPVDRSRPIKRQSKNTVSSNQSRERGDPAAVKGKGKATEMPMIEETGELAGDKGKTPAVPPPPTAQASTSTNPPQTNTFYNLHPFSAAISHNLSISTTTSGNPSPLSMKRVVIFRETEYTIEIPKGMAVGLQENISLARENLLAGHRFNQVAKKVESVRGKMPLIVGKTEFYGNDNCGYTLLSTPLVIKSLLPSSTFDATADFPDPDQLVSNPMHTGDSPNLLTIGALMASFNDTTTESHGGQVFTGHNHFSAAPYDILGLTTNINDPDVISGTSPITLRFPNALNPDKLAKLISKYSADLSKQRGTTLIEDFGINHPWTLAGGGASLALHWRCGVTQVDFRCSSPIPTSHPVFLKLGMEPTSIMTSSVLCSTGDDLLIHPGWEYSITTLSPAIIDQLYCWDIRRVREILDIRRSEKTDSRNIGFLVLLLGGLALANKDFVASIGLHLLTRSQKLSMKHSLMDFTDAPSLYLAGSDPFVASLIRDTKELRDRVRLIATFWDI